MSGKHRILERPIFKTSRIQPGIQRFGTRRVVSFVCPLIPSEWLTGQPGVLAMPHSTVHLRYLRQPLSIEVISVPNDRNDGPAILIRIPDTENTGVGPRYFESMQLDDVVYPNPFAPIAEIIASGWQPQLFKQTHIPDDQRTQLEQWSRMMTNNK
jgi:hypothetical protein